MKKDIKSATSVDEFVGAQLKALRKAAGWSQAKLANQVGVTIPQIRKYECGSNRIGASRLWGFCQALKVKPGSFFDGVEEYLTKLER